MGGTIDNPLGTGGAGCIPFYGDYSCIVCGQMNGGHSLICPVARENPPTKTIPFFGGDAQMPIVGSKPSNPKDALGANRAPLAMVSDLAEAEESLAMLEGALKYGAYNYRGIGVRVSVYLDAAMRHIRRFKNGEDRDPKTGVHHLGYARACLGIIFESIAMGNLVDDRPPRCQGAIDAIDAMEERIKHLKSVFADYHPKHYTIADGQEPPDSLFLRDGDEAGTDQPGNGRGPLPVSKLR
jgi:Domain of unknown function (DUF5664)